MWSGPSALVPDPEDVRGAPAETSLRSPALASVGVASLVDRSEVHTGTTPVLQGPLLPPLKAKVLGLGRAVRAWAPVWRAGKGSGRWWLDAGRLPSCRPGVAGRCYPCPACGVNPVQAGDAAAPLGIPALLGWTGSLRNWVLEGHKLSHSAYTFFFIF